jgi:hypothetical protein
MRFHIGTRGRGIIRQKQDSAPAQLGGHSAAHAERAVLSRVVEAELQLDVIAPVDSPISVYDLNRHSSSKLYDGPIPTECTDQGVPARIGTKVLLDLI